MLKYQIHKLSKGGGEARSVFLEDILTSDVFGVMYYLPYDLLLKPFLEQIKVKNPYSNFRVPDEEPTKTLFWNSYSWPEILPSLNRTSIEPDVVLEWDGMIIFVEAKFVSPTDPEELLREFLVSQTVAATGQDAFLLLIDGNILQPSVSGHKLHERSSIREYLTNRIGELDLTNKFLSNSVRDAFLWCNWQGFYLKVQELINDEFLSYHNGRDQITLRILKDLLDILTRKNLLPFEALSLKNLSELCADLDTLNSVGRVIRNRVLDLARVDIDLSCLDTMGQTIISPLPFLLEYSLDIGVMSEAGFTVNNI